MQQDTEPKLPPPDPEPDPLNPGYPSPSPHLPDPDVLPLNDPIGPGPQI